MPADVIQWTEVRSSNVARFRYAEAEKVLDIQFVNSFDTYSYDEVPKEVAAALGTSVSPGQYFRN